MRNCFMAGDILLPDFSKVEGIKWATIACDQFTSEPQYWQGAESLVGDAPSVLHLILPEVWLDKKEEYIPKIHCAMEEYEKKYLSLHRNCMIYVERTQSDGTVRHGLVGMVDLESYEYSKDATSLIRATEGTVLERIPPRQEVRRGGVLETPHVMLLIDDPRKTVIEPLTAVHHSFVPAYDFDLMLGGGHIKAWFVPQNQLSNISLSLSKLTSKEEMKAKYGRDDLAPMLYAVGDGNHSLASAKACYEEIKRELGDKALSHPARYALCEVVNLHDEALQFEPIYRVVFHVNPQQLWDDFKQFSGSLHGIGTAKPQLIKAVWGQSGESFVVNKPLLQLPVATLQTFLDGWIKAHADAKVDYIHDEASVMELCCQPDTIGFLFDGMKKEQLFSSVMQDGPLPRKTFSMGHARDKRYCLECRKIVE